MSVGALITADAIKRAEIIDAELGWPSCLALGKMARIWNEAQEGEGKSVVKRRVLLEWARVPAHEADAFLALCCKVGRAEDDDHIHFLEALPEERYRIVGNSKRLEKLEENRQKKAAAGRIGGKQKAENDRKRRESESKPPDPAPAEASALADARADAKAGALADARADAKADGWQNSSPLPFPSAVPSPLPEGEEDARAHVDPPSPHPTGMKAEDLVAIWNECRGELPRVVGDGGKHRREAIAAALRAHDDPGFWRTAFGEAVASSFLTGKKAGADGKPFTRPLFDWLVESPDYNARRAGEGHFRDKKATLARASLATDVPENHGHWSEDDPTGFENYHDGTDEGGDDHASHH
jgi:hypothetical protein